jgi:hypothetical protein
LFRREASQARLALPTGGSLTVYVKPIDDERRAHLRGLLTSLNVLTETRVRFDLTAAD